MANFQQVVVSETNTTLLGLEGKVVIDFDRLVAVCFLDNSVAKLSIAIGSQIAEVYVEVPNILSSTWLDVVRNKKVENA